MCLLILAIHCTLLLPLEKETYLALHPYWSWLPVMAFFILRSRTATLRTTYAPFFAAIGKRSMELYLMQFHLWLGVVAKANVFASFMEGRFIGLVTQSTLFWSVSALALSATSFLVGLLRNYPRIAVLAMIACILLLTPSWKMQV
jgi:hypothetical protein